MRIRNDVRHCMIIAIDQENDGSGGLSSLSSDLTELSLNQIGKRKRQRGNISEDTRTRATVRYQYTHLLVFSS